MKSAVWIPLFDDLADPLVVAALAAEAEDAGWDGFFVWDHVRWREPVPAAADPWISLAAIATATSTLRLGPMVSALPRRRPQMLARHTATLDRLSSGRLILGAGLGSDRFGGEFSRFGDEVDDRTRAAMLDESLAILSWAWTGEPVRHRGEHFTVDDVAFHPRPVQPTVPVWIAGFPGKVRPLHRAARHDGFVPVNLEHPDQLAEAVATITELRAPSSTPYDVAVTLPADADLPAFRGAGATWWLTDFDPHAVTVDQVRAVVRAGPFPP